MQRKVTYKDIYKFSWSYWKCNGHIGLWALLFLVFSTLLDIAIPVYSGKIVDAMAVGTEGNANEIIHAIAILLGLVISLYTARWAAFFFYNDWECYSMRNLLAEALYKVQRFSTDWHANNFGGGAVTRITRARRSFEVFEDTLFINIVPSIIVMFGMSGMLIVNVPSVGIYAFFMILIYVGFSLYTSYKILDPYIWRFG
jgi:ATP-binding cassette subfamily B protein